MRINYALLKMLFVFAGAVLFTVVFWHEKLALNAIFFDAFILGSVFYLYPAAFTKPQMKWLLMAHLIALCTVVIHNTALSKIAFSVTLLLLVVFIQYVHRSVWYAAASAVSNYVLLIFSFFDNATQLKKRNIRFTSLRRAMRFIIIPVILASVFFVMYCTANAVFQTAVNDVGLAIQTFVTKLFSWFEWERFTFLLFGIVVTGGLLLRAAYNGFSEKDQRQKNDLYRKKNNLKAWKESALYDLLTVFMGRFANGIMALGNENTVGIISLALLNILLLVINAIDIIYVWFGFNYSPDVNLKNMVHEGAGLLIFSIILAVAVVLFFFRGNLNFYKKNKWLRYGAYGWIIQNAILVVSVLLRDSYYIQHLGLAYKRIGLLFFLLMVLFGLATVFIKISQKKTAYYLLRVNGWFGIVLLVAASCIHWDETMAAYNLSRKNTVPVDVKFLLTLSDKALPLLEANGDVLDKPQPSIPGEGDYLYRSVLTPRELFEQRKQNFIEQQQEYTWLSWNAADAYVEQKIGKGKTISSLKK